MIIAYIYFIWIFFTVIQAIVAGGEVYAIVIRIVKTKCIGGVAEAETSANFSIFDKYNNVPLSGLYSVNL